MYAKVMPLTFDQVNEFIAYDPGTGSFTWRKAPNRRTKVGTEAGSFKLTGGKGTKAQIWYKYIHVCHQQTPAARIAWLLSYEKWPEGNIQFRDEDSRNLRLSNLKEAQFSTVKSIKDGRRSYKMSSEAGRHYGIKKYGITVEQYNQMLADQQGVCAICRQPETGKSPWGGPVKQLSIDHDHETNAVRGLLCTQCNYMIGHCRESRDVLLAGVRYLDKHSGREVTTPALTIAATEALQ